MNKKGIYFGILEKCLTVIMRPLRGMLICSNRQCVIVALVSLTWQLLYKVSALQSRKRGCFSESESCCLIPREDPTPLLHLEQWCCRVPEVPRTAVSCVSCLVSHLQADSSSQGTVPHQSFEMRAAMSLGAGGWWYLVSVVEDDAEFLLVFAVSQLPKIKSWCCSVYQWRYAYSCIYCSTLSVEQLA